MRRPHKCLRRPRSPLGKRYPSVAPHEALEQEAKPGAQVGHRPLFCGLDAQSLVAFEPAGLHLSLERSETSPHPLALYHWNSSSSLGQWTQAEEAKSIGEEQEVWIRETVAAIGREKTWSEQVEAVVEEEEDWIVTSLVYPSPAGPQLGRIGWSGAFS